LKLKCDEPLSKVPFNLNVRRYTMVVLSKIVKLFPTITRLGRAVQVDSIKTRVESAFGFRA
jgi:hypothetical protein